MSEAIEFNPTTEFNPETDLIPEHFVNSSSRHGHPIRYVLVHYTGSSNARSALNWFHMKSSRVSSHIVLDKDGKMYYGVPFERAAWHAGGPSWWNKTRFSMNSESIGIEIVNNGNEPYTKAQMESLIKFSRWARKKFPGLRERELSDTFIGHQHWIPNNKSDPGPLFDWHAYYSGILGRDYKGNYPVNHGRYTSLTDVPKAETSSPFSAFNLFTDLNKLGDTSPDSFINLLDNEYGNSHSTDNKVKKTNIHESDSDYMSFLNEVVGYTQKSSKNHSYFNRTPFDKNDISGRYTRFDNKNLKFLGTAHADQAGKDVSTRWVFYKNPIKISRVRTTGYFIPPPGGYKSKKDAKIEGGAKDRFGNMLRPIQSYNPSNPNSYVSIATDPRVIPSGSLLNIEGFGNIKFLAVDVGSAIKGAHHIDIASAYKPDTYALTTHRDIYIIGKIKGGSKGVAEISKGFVWPFKPGGRYKAQANMFTGKPGFYTDPSGLYSVDWNTWSKTGYSVETKPTTSKKEYSFPGVTQNKKYRSVNLSGKALKSTKYKSLDVLSKPIEGNIQINSWFRRKSKGFGKGKFHGGLDIDAEGGTSVKAVTDGVIVGEWNQTVHGMVTNGVVVMSHAADGTPFITRYVHLHERKESNKWKYGDRVKRGDIIGHIDTTAGHLHIDFGTVNIQGRTKGSHTFKDPTTGKSYEFKVINPNFVGAAWREGYDYVYLPVVQDDDNGIKDVYLKNMYAKVSDFNTTKVSLSGATISEPVNTTNPVDDFLNVLGSEYSDTKVKTTSKSEKSNIVSSESEDIPSVTPVVKDSKSTYNPTLTASSSTPSTSTPKTLIYNNTLNNSESKISNRSLNKKSMLTDPVDEVYIIQQKSIKLEALSLKILYTFAKGMAENKDIFLGV